MFYNKSLFYSFCKSVYVNVRLVIDNGQYLMWLHVTTSRIDSWYWLILLMSDLILCQIPHSSELDQLSIWMKLFKENSTSPDKFSPPHQCWQHLYIHPTLPILAYGRTILPSPSSASPHQREYPGNENVII